MGTALGYFLELWGTTRECWTYYTQATPPVIAAFAHGFASVAFGRAATVGMSLLEFRHLPRWIRLREQRAGQSTS